MTEMTEMYEFSWFENHKKITIFVNVNEHKEQWEILNKKLKRGEITFPFCILRKT